MVQLKFCSQTVALSCAALLVVAPAAAQTPVPVGDGLNAIYYDGVNFERPLLRRRDAAIDFDWQQNEPGPGLPTEFFSVRWQGWLVPPASGRYILHITTDDGMRVWLNDRLVLDEWRPQPVSNFSAAVQLQAGQPYKLRVEYYQSILDTRARLTWERPDVKPPSASWRNGWGVAGKPKEEVVSGRYLFTRNPGLPPVAVPAPKPLPKPAPKLLPPVATGGPRPASLPPRLPVALPPRPAPPMPLPESPASPAAPADSLSRRRVAQLNAGQEITLPELLFDQGKAELLPPARAALDALASGLQAQPVLRLEVQGHTDNQGNAELNRQLSQQRAETVCLYLTAHGVASERLRPVGYGGTRPVASNNDPQQRSRNRRVVIKKLE